jgi:polysaccharide export outer membrane protein
MLRHRVCRCRLRRHWVVPARPRSLVRMTLARPTFGLLHAHAVALLLCTGLLAGCGASLNSESVNGELQAGAIADELASEKAAASSPTTESKNASPSKPTSITTASVAKPESKPARPAASVITPAPKSESTSAPTLARAGVPQAENKPVAPSPSVAKAAEDFTQAATPGSAAYKIGPQDELEISVFKVPELTRTVQVAEIGTINLPLVGEVPAAGRTARDIERDLTAKLGAKYLQSPQVTVSVKEYNSQRVTIEGAVRKPGVYPIRSRTTLMQLTAMAGGLGDAADYSSVVVIRQVNNKRSAQKFDMNEIRSGRAPDPVVAQGDVVVVSHSQMKAAWHTFLKGLGVAGSAAVFF